MNALELLQNHPKAGEEIKKIYLQDLVNSLDSYPEEFRAAALEMGISDDRIAALMEVSPRALFDVFDSYKICIETIVDTDGGFWWKIGDTQSSIGYEFRKNCDSAAITEAFKLLEEKL